MNYYKRILAVCLSVTVLAGLLGGCESLNVLQQEASEEEAFVGLESEPDLSYEVPKSTVGILVNQIGYKPKEDKVIIFQGKEIPETFSVISREDGKCVYQGVVEREDKVGYGDFTDFEQEGVYQIYCEKLGNSYPFQIKEDLYTEWSNSYFDSLKECFGEETEVVSKAVSMLMFSYELCPDVFIEESEPGQSSLDKRLALAYEFCVKLLENQKIDGSIASILREAGEEDNAGEPDINSTFLLAACMAKFSYLYQTYDNQTANQCLKAADKAWKYARAAVISNSQTEYDSTYQFFAAAELFRSTGAYQYHLEAKDYIQTYEQYDLDNEVQLLGLMTYLSTKRKVDIELCNEIMKQIMAASEEISKKSKQSLYLAESDSGEDLDSLLWDMVILSISDSVLSTKEYATVLENHVHFLLGRNQRAVSYLSVEGSDYIDDTMQIENHLERSIDFLFLLSNMA